MHQSNVLPFGCGRLALCLWLTSRCSASCTRGAAAAATACIWACCSGLGAGRVFASAEGRSRSCSRIVTCGLA